MSALPIPEEELVTHLNLDQFRAMTGDAEERSRAELLLEKEHTLVIGHRGFAELAPENTLASFNLALEAGADLVELDCHQTHDGQLVVFHDSQLDRTTDAVKVWKRKRILLSSKTALELGELDAGSWFSPKFAGVKIPSLSESVQTIFNAGRVTLIERKSGEASVYAALLREKSFTNRVIVISFDWHFLRALHEREPRHILGALGPPAKLVSGGRTGLKQRSLNARWLDLLAGTGARIVVWNKCVSMASVELAHERGLKVWIYTVDPPALARKLVECGVDGIITNNPTRIRVALEVNPPKAD